MSMSKPVCPNMATATPSARRVPGVAQAAQEQHAGCSRWRRNHTPPESVFPRARHGRSLPRCGELAFRTPTRHRAPETGTWNDPDPRRRSSRGSGAQNRPARQWRLRDACTLSRRWSRRFLALRCQAHTPSCSRQVTSTSIRMVKPGPASALRGHAPLRTDTLSLARTISCRIGVAVGFAGGAGPLRADRPVLDVPNGPGDHRIDERITEPVWSRPQ